MLIYLIIIPNKLINWKDGYHGYCHIDKHPGLNGGWVIFTPRITKDHIHICLSRVRVKSPMTSENQFRVCMVLGPYLSCLVIIDFKPNCRGLLCEKKMIFQQTVYYLQGKATRIKGIVHYHIHHCVALTAKSIHLKIKLLLPYSSIELQGKPICHIAFQICHVAVGTGKGSTSY